MTRRIPTLLTGLAVLATCVTSAAAQTNPAVVVEYYHLDALGSVRVVTDQNGQILKNASGVEVGRHDFLPFGEEWNPPATAKEKKLFTGHERDADTGLDYFGARYYRANIGRFTTVDPLQTTAENLTDPQRWNRYAYVRNNPLRWTDPDGRQIMRAPPGYSSADAAENKAKRDAIKQWVTQEFGEATAAFVDCLLGFGGLPVSKNEMTFALGGELAGAATAVTSVRGAAVAVEHYALAAVEDGLYPVMRRGFSEPQGSVWMNAGDVWKYGTTKNPATRYTQKFLSEGRLLYRTLSTGTLGEALAAEKAGILSYRDLFGVLPAGNKIIR